MEEENHKERKFFMALNAIDKVRDAELSAQRSIDEAEAESARRIQDAYSHAESIIASAEEKALAELRHKEEKAYKSADEIKVTSRNAAVLSVEKLKRSCSEKQQTVNKKILEIII